jgi:hypothetical protein
MPLHSLDINLIREKCRARIEAIELWMRRIIAEELAASFGENFINHQVLLGDFLIKKEIRTNINKRYDSSPSSFPRPIDAAFFENLIDIFCNPNLYKNHFKKYMSKIYPSTLANQTIYLKFHLERLKDIRNNLSHGNSISIRDAEFVLSITAEHIESYKNFYYMTGKQQEYNVPQIIKITDSFGNVFIRKDFQNYGSHDFSNNAECFLRPGDVLSIEVEVDPSYTDTKYQFRFGGTPQDYSYNNKLIYTLRMSDVDKRKPIYCQIRSDKDWHKQFNMDDQVTLFYKVLPPLE